MFQVGDTVKLKSGGPHMTVTQVGNGVTGVPTVRCTWFEGNEQKTGGFPAAGLQVVQTEGVSAS